MLVTKVISLFGIMIINSLQIIEKKVNPWIFHMSWTENKRNKVLFMKQMGLWYVTEECREGSVVDEVQSNLCCSKEPLISCHCSDKPR